MPPKAAEKKPTTGGKAPAGKAPAAEKKEAGKKTATAPSGEKKKRGKTRKETYSSYIYKGMSSPLCNCASQSSQLIHILNPIQSLTSNTNASSLVLKQVHPDTGISNRAMSILNSFVNGKQNPHKHSQISTNSPSQTSLNASPLKPPSSPPTTRSPPSLPERFRPPSASSYLVSLPSTPCLKAPRPSPSTPAPPNRFHHLAV